MKRWAMIPVLPLACFLAIAAATQARAIDMSIGARETTMTLHPYGVASEPASAVILDSSPGFSMPSAQNRIAVKPVCR